MNFELTVATRYLRRGRRQTALTVCGVVVGVVALLVTMGMLEGWKEQLLDKTIGSSPHIEIYRPKESPALKHDLLSRVLSGHVLDTREKRLRRRERLQNYTELQAIVERNPAVAATCATLQESAIVSRGDRNVMVTLRGADVEAFESVTPFLKHVREGNMLALGADGAAIGYRLADDLGVELGQKLVVVSPQGITRRLTVRAIYRTGFYNTDAAMLHVSLRTAQNLSGVGREASAVLVRLHSPHAAARIARQLEAATEADARSWMEINVDLLQALKLNDQITYLIISMTLVVSAFGIAGVLIMVVLEKSREIGILKSMGATQRQIQRVFLMQGALVGLVGGVLGSGLGALACVWISHQKIDMPPEFSLGLEVESWPMKLSWPMFAICLALALALALAASYFPARRAGRLDPVEVIRRG